MLFRRYAYDTYTHVMCVYSTERTSHSMHMHTQHAFIIVVRTCTRSSKRVCIMRSARIECVYIVRAMRVRIRA